MSGDVSLAIDQLELALAQPEIDEYQRARFEARLDEIREANPRNRRRSDRDGDRR